MNFHNSSTFLLSASFMLIFPAFFTSCNSIPCPLCLLLEREEKDMMHIGWLQASNKKKQLKDSMNTSRVSEWAWNELGIVPNQSYRSFATVLNHVDFLYLRSSLNQLRFAFIKYMFDSDQRYLDPPVFIFPQFHSEVLP